MYIVAPYNVNITAGDIMDRPATVEYEDDLLLTCIASGGPNNMFQWFKDDDLLDENTDNILYITNITADDGGLYECVVNNTAGNSSANITIYGMYVYFITLYITYT